MNARTIIIIAGGVVAAVVVAKMAFAASKRGEVNDRLRKLSRPPTHLYPWQSYNTKTGAVTSVNITTGPARF